jgi:hypothetical protein
MKRLMTKSEAAAYCSLSMTQFTQWIDDGRISPAIPGTHRFDKVKLDADLDRLSGVQSTAALSPLEQWKAKRHARENARGA